MARLNSALVITLDGTGTEIPVLNTTDLYDLYILEGSVTATGNYAIVPTGTALVSTTYQFRYRGTVDITTNGTTFAIFGTNITQAQLLKDWDVECYYNGTSWEVTLYMDFSEADIISATNLGAVVTGSSITNSSIDACTKLVNLSVCTAKINDLAVTTGKMDNLAVTDAKLAANSVITSKILDGNVTNAKLANADAYSVIGNNTAAPAVPTYIPFSTLVNTTAWGLTGNSGLVAGTNFIGTTDAVDLVFKANNIESGRINLSLNNLSFGRDSLLSSISGIYNAAFGRNALTNTTTGDHNVSIGHNTLFTNVAGIGNVSVGNNTLYNSNSNYNTALGYSTLQQLTSGEYNTAVGSTAGNTITTGSYNTFLGYNARAAAPYINAQRVIAIGYNAETDADYQFAIPTDITHLNFALNAHTLGAILTTDSNGYGVWNVPSINAVTGDSATINAISGRIKKDTSGSTFTLTNSFITANSIILLTAANAAIDATATGWTVLAGVGSCTITFNAAPTANFDMNFLVIN